MADQAGPANEPTRGAERWCHVAITGASGGIGGALATLYAAPGRRLSLCGRDATRLAETAKACGALGGVVDAARLDVRDADAMAAWLEARDAAQPIDLLIANAGIGGARVIAPETGEPGAIAREILDVNTMGVVNTVTPILPRMVGRRRGAIVLIGSIAGLTGLPHSPVYSASKAAVLVYGDGLRRLVARSGVHVMTVLPGFVDTPMSRSLGAGRPFCWTAEEAAARIAADLARGRRHSVFPWQLRLALALQANAPAALVDRILARSVTGLRRHADPDNG